MKIGILTFHCAHNYGAVLQCYAMQEFLKKLGHDVKVIDYRPSYFMEGNKPLNFYMHKNIFRLVGSAIYRIARYPWRLRRFKAFNRFIESKFDLLSYGGEGSAASQMDAYIFGSDQIWNPLITGGDDVFWGNLPFEKHEKKYITYAASMGKSTISEDEKTQISERLKNFDAISVRESSLKNLLASLVREVTLVLDPTLLVPRSIWDKLDDNVKETGYVLIYQVVYDSNVIEFAKHIARQLNVKIIRLEGDLNWRVKPGGKTCASPEDFVSYVKHASCVVTTSFHGTAFSVIFNKPFYVLKMWESHDVRSKSLLSSLHLGNRMVGKLDRPQFSDGDFTEANKILSRLRKDSEFFLTQNLK